MTERKLFVVAILTTLFVLAALIVSLLIAPLVARHTRLSTNPLHGRSNMVDWLQMWDGELGLRPAKWEHVTLKHGSPAEIVLNDERTNTFPRYGTWTSNEIEFPFGVTEFIPSWNVTTPPDTGIWFSISTRDSRSGEWSPWLYIGQWGRTLFDEDRPVEFAHGAVHVDNLLLDRPASAVKIRAKFQSFSLDKSVNPAMRRIAVVCSGQVSDPQQYAKLVRAPKIEGDWRRDLGVPFRPQGDGYKSFAGIICSPTSTSMVLQYFGVNLPTNENALAIYDPENDMFGNWGRNVARAGELGMDAWIDRFRNWDQVKAMIAKGQPLIANIRFNKDEFPGNIQPSTAGHLIVLRGMTRDGDIIVNDPASRAKGNGVIYKASELGKAWFDNSGGVAYVIHPTTRESTAQAR
ncbi:MAG TPA: C39 family peptidase [Tepidisphaeraceae bacterium]|nr:C39 family peptidase [Tepidisphaeraceae bacterium]